MSLSCVNKYSHFFYKIELKVPVSVTPKEVARELTHTKKVWDPERAVV